MMWILFFVFVATVSSFGQSTQCVHVQGQVNASGQTALTCTGTPSSVITPGASGVCYNPAGPICTSSVTVLDGDTIVLSSTRAVGTSASSITMTGCTAQWTTYIYSAGSWFLQTSVALNVIPTPGPCQITVNAGTNPAEAWVAQAYSGVGSIANNVSSTAVQTAATSCSPPNITTTTPDSTIVGLYFVLGVPAITAQAGTSLRTTQPMLTNATMVIADKPSPTPATVATGIAISPGADCVAAGVELIPIGVTPPTPPANQLTINPQACAPGTIGLPFSCTILAVGGTTPYSWLSTGNLPAGLTRTNNVISGTPTAVGSAPYTMTATDSSSPVQTASIQLTINVNPVQTGCGFPAYNCARQDAVRRSFSLYEIPPDAGATHCTLPLTACNNAVGLNQIILEPEYGLNGVSNAHIVRISDGGDSTGGCTNPSVGPGGAAEFNMFEMNSNYIGLSCNVPSSSTGLKWLDGSTGGNTGEVITTFNPQGWVLQATGSAVWTTSGTIRFAYTHPNTFFNFPASTQVIKQTITNGRVDATSTIMADYVYAVPCWHDIAVMHPNIGECGEWVANHNYPAGSTLCPSCGTWTVSNPGKNVPGTCPPGANSGACAGPHSFDLLNTAPCTSGGTEPNWSLAAVVGTAVTSISLTGTSATYTYTPVPNQPAIAVGGFMSMTGTTVGGHSTNPNMFNITRLSVTAVTSNTFTVTIPACTGNQTAAGCVPTGQGNVPATAQTNAFTTVTTTMQHIALHDGTCIWGDMWIPPQYSGGRITWGAGKVGDITDSIFSQALSNHGGQDGVGGCYAVWYNSNTKTYSYLNMCNGAVYNTVCTGGSDYQCTGGTWAQTYLGNVRTANTNSCGTPYARVMHQDFGSKSNLWSYITGGGNAVGGVPFQDFAGVRLPTASGNCTGVLFWWSGTLKLIEALSSGAVGAFGHMVPGMNVWMWRPPANSSPMLYLGQDFSAIPAGPWPGTPLAATKVYFNVNDGTCNAGAGNFGCASSYGAKPTPPATVWTCSPNPCIGPQNGNVNLMWRTVNWDEHSSWVSNNGTDTSPVCDETFPNNPGAIFPPSWAWQYEVFCWQTDGSNRVTRHAYLWNSWSAPPTGTGQFANAAGIGSLSSDGNWWAFNSDWYCTLGLRTGSAAPLLCGLLFFLNTAYQVGDLIGAPYSQGGRIYKVTQAGTTSNTAPAGSDYCTAVNCSFTNGGVIFTYQGQANARDDVFIVKLQ